MPRLPRINAACFAIFVSSALAMGCDGAQSALSPASAQAAQIALLFWSMVAGSALILTAVVALALYASHAKREPTERPKLQRFIVGAGVIFPTVVLTGLLAYGLWLIPVFLAPAPPESLRIHVVGEQWWWRIQYLDSNGHVVDVANELHLPVNRSVEFTLESPDVIHAFWIPSLGGKVDMIPGRENRLTLTPDREGSYRGVCAEYCGTSHALMAFPVVVQSAQAFEQWLDQQAQPAHEPVREALAEGARQFVENGCGACHVVRGTAARGSIGPDLTHVGSRLSVGAGTLAPGRAQLRRFITEPHAVKPDVLMPAFGMLDDAKLDALAAYLESLR